MALLPWKQHHEARITICGLEIRSKGDLAEAGSTSFDSRHANAKVNLHSSKGWGYPRSARSFTVCLPGYRTRQHGRTDPGRVVAPSSRASNHRCLKARSDNTRAVCKQYDVRTILVMSISYKVLQSLRSRT